MHNRPSAASNLNALDSKPSTSPIFVGSGDNIAAEVLNKMPKYRFFVSNFVFNLLSLFVWLIRHNARIRILGQASKCNKKN